MLFTRATYIGVDPSRGKYAVAYAALDADLKLLALGSGNADEALAFLGGQRQAVVIVNAPQKLSAVKQAGSIVEDALDCQDCRKAEAELIKLGYSSYETPALLKQCKPWVKLGFEIYEHIIQLGYRCVDDRDQLLRFHEGQSNTCYHRWIGCEPLHKYSLEGRIQRQIVLRDLNLPVQEPMNFFEEITRYRLLQGELPDEMLQTPDELDVLALAYLAWKIDQSDNDVKKVGDAEEGFICFPGNSLAEYRGRY